MISGGGGGCGRWEQQAAIRGGGNYEVAHLLDTSARRVKERLVV